MNSNNAFARMRLLALSATMTVIVSAAGADPAAGSFVPVEGGSIWYQSCGSGPKAIVLIHDGILHSATWDDVWPTLCQEFHVVRYDRRGYGRSPAAAAPYSPVDDLKAVMHAAGLEHAMLVGSSSGGGLAVDFTIQHPSAVDGLVLSGPAVSGIALSQYFFERQTALLQKARQGDYEGALRGSWAFAPGHDAAREEAVALLMANPQDVNHLDPAKPAPLAKPLLSSIKAPTLILIGEYDIADNQGQAGALEALIPGSKRIVVRDTGHLMYMERPELFAQLVEQFANADAGQSAPSPSIQSPRGGHTEIAMDKASKQAFVGQYQIAPNFILTITLDGDQLYGQATGQSPIPIFPESPTQLFSKAIDAQLSFETGPDGKPISLTMHQNGHDRPAKRIN